MKREVIQKLPKIELHCHLDGSVSMALLEKLAAAADMPLERLAQAAAPRQCPDLKTYLASFDVILALLQSEENLALAAFDVVCQAAAENVRYLELRFAPQLHREAGLSLQQVIKAVVKGIAQGERRFPIKVNLLLCGIRQQAPSVNEELLAASILSAGHGRIVGFDFAGDEQAVPPEKLKGVIKQIREAGFLVTLHAGECGCSQNVLTSIKLGAKRIGHGVAVKDDPQARAFCKEQQVLLELCPTSNLQTNAVSSMAEYPLRTFLAEGVACCINTDNRCVSQTSLTQEYWLLAMTCQLTYQEMLDLNQMAIRGSFAAKAVKEQLEAELFHGYHAILFDQDPKS